MLTSQLKTKSRFHKANQQLGGFALVATLSLMILLAILGVGLLGLSSVALRQASTGSHEAEARANARLALILAIGQLQKTAGPDQRITIGADQLTETGGDGSETAAASEHRHWTGVYHSWLDEEETRPEPDFLTWLASGTPEALSSRDSVKTSATDPVILVDSGTLGETKAGRVSVPAMRLGKGDARLAWWTGDQGIKATLDAPLGKAATLAADVRADLQAARQMGVQLAATENDKRPFGSLGSMDIRRNLVTSWPQAAFASSDKSSHRNLFHDLAPHSSGLLTNVRNGGFRKDLSMYLERTKMNAPREHLYEASGRTGINFAELWFHYNIYKEFRTGSLNFTTGGSTDAPSLRIAGTQTAMTADHANTYKQPAIISYKAVLSFHARRINTPDGPKERLHLVVDPIITYWNPLDVPVSLSPAYNSVKFWQLPYDLTLRYGERTLNTSLRRILASTQFHYLTLIAGKLEPIVLKPGEVLVYSQASNTPVATYLSSGLNYVNGRAGWNLGGGVAIPLRDSANQFVDGNSNDTLEYEIRPNNDISLGSNHWFLTAFGLYYKEDRTQRGESVSLGNNSIDQHRGDPYHTSQKPANLRLRATSFPGVFNKIRVEDTRPLMFSQLSNRKEPFMLYAHNAKTEFGSDRGGRWLARQNTQMMKLDFGTLSEAELDLIPYEIQIEPLDSWKNRNLEVTPNGSGFFGGGMNAEFGTNYLVTHAVPREPIHSLAAFQNAFANGYQALPGRTGHNMLDYSIPLLPLISHPIGNSLAPSVLSPSDTIGALDGGRMLADHSFLANRELWDDWFLSSISPDISTPRPQRQVASDFLKGTSPLPNARFRPALSPAESDRLLALWFSDADPTSDAHLLTAAALRVDGLFNVNSTSVEAWKAVLGTLREKPVITRDTGGKESVTPSEMGTTPVANMIASENLIARGNGNVDVTETAQWIGRRTLSDDEINSLAEALVREIRRRGPFLSLADFINRRPGSDPKLAAAGAIQSALDSQEAGINASYLQGDRRVSDDIAKRFPFPEAEAGAAAYGAPGVIKQADILTPIAPILSVRSDSFIIRAYGESVAGGKIIARAWCEAVVERQPDYINPSDDGPNTAANEITSETNRSFGRRFETTSFRWINPEEI